MSPLIDLLFAILLAYVFIGLLSLFLCVVLGVPDAWPGTMVGVTIMAMIAMAIAILFLIHSFVFHPAGVL